jgi:hypothetical protein
MVTMTKPTKKLRSNEKEKRQGKENENLHAKDGRRE